MWDWFLNCGLVALAQTPAAKHPNFAGTWSLHEEPGATGPSAEIVFEILPPENVVDILCSGLPALRGRLFLTFAIIASSRVNGAIATWQDAGVILAFVAIESALRR